LLERLLGEQATSVQVKTVDSIARQLLTEPQQTSPHFASNLQQHQLLKESLVSAIATLPGNKIQRHAKEKILERLSLNYLQEEINTVIEARGIKDLDPYLQTARSGREVPLNQTQRQAIWHLRETFYKKLTTQNLETWQQFRTRAVKCLESMTHPSLYDAVLVDEAQDLDPNALRLLTLLCRAPNRLFITADANQSIYGSGFRWQDVHHTLNFVGRTGILQRNHRTTQEINEAAHSYLSQGVLDPVEEKREYVHTGPPPAVRAVTNTEDEAALLVIIPADPSSPVLKGFDPNFWNLKTSQ